MSAIFNSSNTPRKMRPCHSSRTKEAEEPGLIFRPSLASEATVQRSLTTKTCADFRLREYQGTDHLGGKVQRKNIGNSCKLLND